MARFCVALAVGLSGVACIPQLDVARNAQLTCETDSDCPQDAVCPVGRCVPQSAVDREGPGLQAAVSESETQIVLSFDAPLLDKGIEDSSHYVFAPQLTVVRAAREQTQKIRLTVQGQVPGKIYVVTVNGIRGFNGKAVPQDANSVTFEASGTPPDTSPPQTLFPARSEAFAISEVGPVLVGWTPREGATQYTVEVDDEPTFSEPLVYSVTVDAPTTSAETLGILEPITYYWRVRADVTAEGEWGCNTFERVMTRIHVYCNQDDCSAPDPGEPEGPCAPLDVESGNLSTPFRSIQRGIEAAAFYGLPEVRVARHGTERGHYAQSFSMRPGVSVYGGYGPSFEERDPSQPTRVKGSGITVEAHGIRSESSLTPTTVLDGFDIETSSSPTAESVGMLITGSSNALAVRNCHISATAAQQRTGLEVASSALGDGPSLTDLVVEVPAPGESLYGTAIRVSDAGVSLQGLEARGPDGIVVNRGYLTLNDSKVIAEGPERASAVSVEGSLETPAGLEAEGNVVHCYGSKKCSGVRLVESVSPSWVLGNRIVVGPSTLGTGVHIERPTIFQLTNGSELGVYNNTIVLANGLESSEGGQERTAGFVVRNGGASIAHNTVILGGGETGYGAGVWLEGHSIPGIYNNLFYLQPTQENTARHGVYEAGAISDAGYADARAIQGNVFAAPSWPSKEEDGPPYVYRDQDGSALWLDRSTKGNTSNNPDGLDGTAVCPEILVGEAAPTCMGQELNVQGSGNATVETSLADLFVDAQGADGNLYKIMDGDFHLHSSNAAAAEGGRALFDEPGPAWRSDCGAQGEGATCPAVWRDAGGAARTLPVSAGAYEQD